MVEHQRFCMADILLCMFGACQQKPRRIRLKWHDVLNASFFSLTGDISSGQQHGEIDETKVQPSIKSAVPLCLQH